MYKIRQIELRNKERLAQANFAISHLSTASNASSETEEHDDDDDVVQVSQTPLLTLTRFSIVLSDLWRLLFFLRTTT